MLVKMILFAVLATAAEGASGFLVSVPSSATAGVPFTFTVTAVNSDNRTDPGYAGTVHFSSQNGALLPSNSTLTNGIGTFTATLRAGGSTVIAAQDTANPAIVGVSSFIQVSGATYFLISAPSTVTAMTTFSCTAIAMDGSAMSTAANYAGTTNVTSTGTGAALPATLTFVNGTATFSVRLKSAGSTLIHVQDNVTGIYGSTTVTVNAAPASHFRVMSSQSVPLGTPLTISATAQDNANNTATGYAGTIHFTSSDGSAVLPSDAKLTNGTGTFSVILRTAGNQSITINDTATPSISGASGPIAAGSGHATHLLISAPPIVGAGLVFVVTVTPLDKDNHVATGYNSTIHVTSTDPPAVLGQDLLLTSGTETIGAVLRTPGTQSIQVVDTDNSSITSNTATITVVDSNSPPSPVAIDPPPGNANGQDMNFAFSDPRGFWYLNVVNILINTALDGRNACYVAYSQPLHSLFLVDDAGDAGGPFAGSADINAPGLISNRQCTISWGEAPVSAAGNMLTLTLHVALDPATQGNKIAYLASGDVNGSNSGWQALGTWALPGSVSGPIAVVGLDPPRLTAGTGTPQTFTATFTDTNGPSDFGIINILVNDFVDGRKACYLAYVASTNTLLLVDDTGDAGGPFAGSMILNGRTAAIQNSQCSISATGSAASVKGNTLSLTLNLTFKSGFVGNRIIWLAARDVLAVNNTNWQAAGSITLQ